MYAARLSQDALELLLAVPQEPAPLPFLAENGGSRRVLDRSTTLPAGGGVVVTSVPTNPLPVVSTLPVYVLPFVLVVRSGPPVGPFLAASSSLLTRARCAAGASLTALAVAGQEPGKVKAALAPEPDVDEDDVQPQRAGLPEGLGGVRGHADDRHALSLEENARCLEEGTVVVNEQVPQCMRSGCPGQGAPALRLAGIPPQLTIPLPIPEHS